MKRSIKFWQVVGFFIVSVLGTALHFLYDLLGGKLTALVSGVNESSWEHMKLLFFPMLLFAIAEYFIIGKNHNSFWCIKLQGICLGLLLIPVIFYTLNGVFGKTPDGLNIAIFFISVATAFAYEARRFNIENYSCKHKALAIAALVLIAVAFAVFTFSPPEIPLFQDPIDASFGI